MPVSELVAMIAAPGFMCRNAARDKPHVRKDVGLKRALEIRVVELLELLAALLSSVRNKNIEPSERAHRTLDDFVAECGIDQIAGDQLAHPPFCFDDRARVFGIRLFIGQIHDRNVGAFACEQRCNRPADSGIAAGDQRGLALQLSGGLVARRIRSAAADRARTRDQAAVAAAS